MSSRGLPGFLRRTLRIVEYDDDGTPSGSPNGRAPPGHQHNGGGGIFLEDNSSGLNGLEAIHWSETQDRGDGDTYDDEGSAEYDLTEEPDDSRHEGRPSYDSEVHEPLTTIEEASFSGVSTTNFDSSISHSNFDTQMNDSWKLESTSQHDQKSTEPPIQKSFKELQFEKLLSVEIVNITELRKLAWNGIPYAYRPLVWKLLLGYIPTNASRREQTLRRKRSEYRDAMAQHYDIDDDTRTTQEQETLRQVLVDVPRTQPDIPLFRNKRIQRILSRLLYIWAMRHPASSYVQGINDLATPLVSVFLSDCFEGSPPVVVLDGHVMNHLSEEKLGEIEADVYWCLTNLLAGIQDHYTADQPGVQRMVGRLEELVHRIDSDLTTHVRDDTGIQFLQFSFKWMVRWQLWLDSLFQNRLTCDPPVCYPQNCLLIREFHLRCVFRLWDTYLSETDGFEDFHVYVCAAFMCQFSGELREMDFDELFGFMQEIPTADWTDIEIEILLSQAYVLSTLFKGSDAHLSGSNSSSIL
jgi:TBC1 domain family member 2